MARIGESADLFKCSFCGKSQKQVQQLIAGPGVYICDECVELCNEIIEERMAESGDGAVADFDLPKPREIFAFLEEYVVGQEPAKRALSVAVYNHYKRVRAHSTLQPAEQRAEDIEIAKSNILLLGPTGCGKTYLAQTLAKRLNVPFAVADATALTEAGYVGEDVENILLKLLQAADFDTKRAETGIIYIDEVDKIARKAENPSITRDVSGEGVQQALLKLLEGTVANIQVRGSKRLPNQETVQVDTSNILFICGGSFEGLEKVIESRIGRRSVGFSREDPKDAMDKNADRQELLARTTTEDLERFGLIPEFIGRIPVTAVMNPLNVEDLQHILTEPRNALIKQYQKLFKFEKVKLRFTDEAILAVAEIAKNRKAGARGLRATLESVMLDIMFEVPSIEGLTEVVITEDVVRLHRSPDYNVVEELGLSGS